MSSAGSNLAVEMSKQQKTRRLSPASIVYWMRLAFGVLAGVIFNVLGLGGQGVALGTLGIIAIGIGVYAVSVFVVRNVLGYGEEELKGPNKHVSIGVGIFIVWMVFTTILLNTILNPSPP